MKKLLFVLLLLSLSKAYAGQVDLTTISKIHFMQNGVIIFETDVQVSGSPSCASQTRRFAIDGTTEGGKVQASGILALYMSKKPIKIVGANNCAAWPDTESVNYFRTDD